MDNAVDTSFEPKTTTGSTFSGLIPPVADAMARAHFTTPTPIQEKAIPVGLAGRDLVGIAETGTGKTLAFTVPIITKLIMDRMAKAVIVAPTRELALQIEESIRQLTHFMPRESLRTVVLIGGAPFGGQLAMLKQNARIVVATPGRLRDHMERRTIRMNEFNTLVLDEADRMFDMGFAPQVHAICEALPAERQTLLFSATFEREVAALANKYQKDPVRIEVSIAGKANDKITQELCYVAGGDKIQLTHSLLEKHKGTTLVFSRTKHGATKLTRALRDLGHAAAEMHSDRSLHQRRHALDGLKRGQYSVLVATDVAARGIDVSSITTVINFDLPDAPADYVHRIGRTGRAGREGLAISLAGLDQVRMVKAIERLITQPIPLSADSPLAPRTDVFERESSMGRNRRGRRGGAGAPRPGGFRAGPAGGASQNTDRRGGFGQRSGGSGYGGGGQGGQGGQRSGGNFRPGKPSGDRKVVYGNW